MQVIHRTRLIQKPEAILKQLEDTNDGAMIVGKSGAELVILPLSEYNAIKESLYTLQHKNPLK